MFGFGFGSPSKTDETTSLLPSNASGNGSSYYFLKSESTEGGVHSSVRDEDGLAVVETLPQGSSEAEFAARPVGIKPRPASSHSRSATPQPTFFQKLFGSSASPPSNRAYGAVGTLSRERKAPVKVEPKVFFANERTFLAWLHASILLAGASVAIVAFADSNPWSQLYGVLLLPVAIAFICYSMYQYARRSAMIRQKSPGPYEDTVGPVVLGVMLILSILAQFAIKLYTMM